MLPRRTFVTALFTLAAAGTLAATVPAKAADKPASPITVVQPWARATIGKLMKTGAAYFEVKNTGAEDKIVAASTPVAKMAQLHHHTMTKAGVMEMRQVKDIVVPAHGSVTLKPGGYHVMLMGLHAPLKQGDHFPLTLTFAKAGKMTVNVTVESIGAMGAMPGMGDKSGAMPGMEKK